MHSRLKISYDQNEILPHTSSSYICRTTPFSASGVINCSICDYELITNEKDRKVYYVKFSKENVCSDFEPGSTIGVLPSNDEEVVNKLLIRLGLEHVADQKYQLCINQNCSNKKATIPKHIPTSGSLRQVFLNNVDLNSVPKKLFLKRLLDYTKDEKELEELSLLCSPKDSKHYQTLIASYTNRNLLALLETFPSCRPPVEILLEHLPALLPRPYSISSSPLNKEYFSITFNVDTFDNSQKGVCASWLEKQIKTYEKHKKCEIAMYMRIPSKFTLPKEESVPIIMIATGTGISPFRSFLEHRHLRISQGAPYGPSWLFYGCRDSTENYLFKKDLGDYLTSGALSRLSESFSRESEVKRYVQHDVEDQKYELSSWILYDKAVVYVCGDYLRVLPAVKEAILKTLMYQNLTRSDAELYLENMGEESRYVVENWN